MIIPVKKILLVGVKENLDQFFSEAQEKGFLEFISEAGKRKEELPSHLQELFLSLKILKKQVAEKNLSQEEDERLNPREIAKKVVSLQALLEECNEKLRILNVEMIRISPFGDFSMQDIEEIARASGRKVQFFCMKEAKSHKTNFPTEVIYISTEYDLDYFMAISKDKIQIPGMIEMVIEKSLGELKEEIKRAKIDKESAVKELKSLKKYETFLRKAFIEGLNEYHLKFAIDHVKYPLDNSFFFVEAWIPENKMDALQVLIAKMNIDFEEIAKNDEETLPTQLDNKGIALLGEDLLKIYDIPAPSDKDPSLWLLFAFALFFAMIIGDAGYGVIYLGIGLYLKKTVKKATDFGKRFINLICFLGVSCIIWGVAMGSYFGLEINYSNPLKHFSFMGYMVEKKADYHLETKDDVYKEWIDQYPNAATATTGKEFVNAGVKEVNGEKKYEIYDEFSDTILLELSLFFGVIHISLAFLRYLTKNWAGLGWVAFMIGGYLYFPKILHATSLVHFLGWVSPETGFKVGLQLLWGGMGFSIVVALIQKKLSGLMEAMNAIAVFADVLSYLRLYALSLAGAIMASTFNQFGVSLGLIIGLFIILIGHFINLTLSIQGGVIHGLRLNFIEWYHYCFEGGGRLFNPLRRLKTR